MTPVQQTTGHTEANHVLAPVFKRRSMTFDMDNYYATNSDVWVYGSPGQYSAFSKLLTSHAGVLRIPADDRGGMDLLILPAAQHASRDFVVIHERLVHQYGRFNMELIVGGSEVGFQSLAKIFRKLARRRTRDADDHIHFDFDDELLILPSVFLNVRAPIDDIDAQLAELAPPSPLDLLPDMEGRDPELWHYEPLEEYASLFGRLPLATNSEP